MKMESFKAFQTKHEFLNPYLKLKKIYLSISKYANNLREEILILFKEE